MALLDSGTHTPARHPGAAGLTPEQLEAFRRDGFVVLRQVFGEEALARFEAAAQSHPPLDQVVPGQTWPGPGRWTLARNAMADPDLAFIMASPEMTEPMRAVLEDDPKVLMFAYYDRTPGGAGIPSHNDYKRWRPIGSSMRWAFAIVPLCDFDEVAGKLELAPGSHRVAHPADRFAPVLDADPPTRPSEDDFVDPELRRGDLAIVDMHLWHRAGANTAQHHRTGLFTKWCAASHPPATGYFPYTGDVARALGPEGAHVLGVWSDRPIRTTRAVLERVRKGRAEVLFLEEDGRLSLPGGPAEEERCIPDWDDGNHIASLGAALVDRLRLQPPWMSWVGDYDEGDDHRCRVYGYRIPGHAVGVGALGGDPEGVVWLTAAEAADRADELAEGFEADAVAAWQDPRLVRGKGVTQALGRADQYAC
jgi:hypothetical protein